MRKRLLNPELFRDEELALVPIEARYLYTGLWCIADREGRLEDRPARIKADVFPYDDLGITMVDQWLTMLHQRWIIRYVVDGKALIQIITFKKHQRCHQNEAKSVLPEPPIGVPMVNHGDPLVNPPTTLVHQCQQMSVGNRYTVYGNNTPLSPPTDEFKLDAPVEPEKPKRQRRSKRNPTDYTPDFLEWYALYPRPEAKPVAFASWLAISEQDRVDALAGLKAKLPAMVARMAAKGDDGAPHPSTWLNQRRWVIEKPLALASPMLPHLRTAAEVIASQRQGPPDAA